MVSLVGIVAGIAAVLAVIVTAVVIAVCLAIGWMTDTARGGRSHSPRGTHGAHGAHGVHGGGRHADHDASYSGQRAQERFPRAGRLAYGQELETGRGPCARAPAGPVTAGMGWRLRQGRAGVLR